jgi:cell division protein FtsI/penicillin-binding protein 2
MALLEVNAEREAGDRALSTMVRLRASFACGVLLIAFAALAGRLFYLQVLCHAEYAREAWKCARAVRPELVHRGDIVDVNGVLLATSFRGNRAPSSLALDWDFLENLPGRGHALSTLVEAGALLSLPADEIIELAGAGASSERAGRKLHWLSIRNRLGAGQTRQVAAYRELYGKVRGGFWKNAVMLSVGHGRHYTFRTGVEPSDRYYELGREIVGSVDAWGDGVMGAEGAFDRLLRGAPGWVEEQQGPVNDFLSFRPAGGLGVTPVAPCDVRLTIDLRLQKIVIDALRFHVEELGLDKAACIIMDPHDGRVLACATWPRQAQAEAVFTLYEPGSIFKAFVACEALIEGKVSVPGPVLWAGGRFRIIPGRKKPVEDVHPGTNLTFADGFVRSSNICFSIVAERIGASGMRKMLDTLALTRVPELARQLWPVSAAKGLTYTGWHGPERIPKQDVISMGWGNAVHVTCLTLARAYAALVNGGYLVEPHILAGLEIPGGAFSPFTPPRTKVIHHDKALATMTDLLRRVVEDEHGTGYRVRVPGLSFGGKTGTAKKYSGGYNKRFYTGGFIAHAPAENPRYVVVVKADIDTQRYKGQFVYGSWNAGPVVQTILTSLYRPALE